MPIRKHGQGWEVRVQSGGRRLSRTVRDRAAAKHLERVWQGRAQDRKVGRTPRYTLEEALTQWLTGEAALLKSLKNLKDKVRAIYPQVQGKFLDEVVPVAGEVKRLGIKKGLKPATINRRLAILRRVAKLAFREWEWLEADLGARIILLPGERARHIHATPEQAVALLAAAPTERGRKAILWACQTGLRKSELRRVDPGDFQGGRLVLPPGKTLRPRAVPLFAGLEADAFPYGLTEWEIDEAFQAARKAIGWPELQFRDLRRTFGSWIVQRTGDLSVTQDLLGHSTPVITKRHYAHLLEGNLRAAVDTLPDLAGQAKKKKRA